MVRLKSITLWADSSFYKNKVYKKSHGHCLLKPWSRDQCECTNISHSNTQFLAERGMSNLRIMAPQTELLNSKFYFF